jgi:hypothetical protein
MSATTKRIGWRRVTAGVLAGAFAVGSVAPAAAQTGGFKPAGTPPGSQTTTQQQTTGNQQTRVRGTFTPMPLFPQPGSATTPGAGSGTAAAGAAQLTGVWADIATLADELAAEFNLTFDNPWEEFFFFMMVARLYFWANGFQTQPSGPAGGATTGTATGGTTGRTGGTTTGMTGTPGTTGGSTTSTNRTGG